MGDGFAGAVEIQSLTRSRRPPTRSTSWWPPRSGCGPHRWSRRRGSRCSIL